MAVTLRDLPEPNELQPPYRPLGHARHSADWLTEDEVAADQRRRLYGAMIELVAEHGYGSASTDDLARLARTSKRDMYRRFPTKENYFLETYDMIVSRAINRVGAAFQSEADWKQRLRSAFQALVAEVVEQPKAARLALSEILGAGPAGLERLEQTRSVFEAIVGSSFNAAPDAPALPPIVVKGIVCGVERIIRQRLLSGRERELPELADELLGWALTYHSPAVAKLRQRTPGAQHTTQGVARFRTTDERIRILRLAAQIAASSGHRQLTPANIATYAGVSAQRVSELCGEDATTCCLESLELLSKEALVFVGRAARCSRDRPVGVHLGIAALMDRVERDQTLCQLAFIEVFRLGPRAIEHREALLAKFSQTLEHALPPGQRATTLAAEATAGAIWGILHYHVIHGQTRRLPGLAGHVSYLALAPAIGAVDAGDAVRRAREVASQGKEPLIAA